DLSSMSDGIQALKHFRLVHESPEKSNRVKTFEFVNGAIINGDGIIDVDIKTNTGREFKYSQKSENGKFIVPYSTTGNGYDVISVGKYKIRGSDKTFDVPEDAVKNGQTIN
ncbi:MAG TPA: oligosaccharyl transferase, archaeosortase A system-associated, partial [Methanocorpusculum sp.]|nr:oligosaccharyl transferase, archaeosortase A system-associated [Methanocorpusculum sp.]